MKKIFSIILLSLIIIILMMGFISCHNKKEIFDLYEKAKKLYQDQKIDQALIYFLQVIKKEKSYKPSYIMAAKCYYFLGKNEECKKILIKTLKRFKHYVDAENLLGKVYFFEQDFKNARICFQNVLYEDSEHIDARFYLAEIDRYEGKYEYANSNYEIIFSYIDILALSKIRTAEILVKYNQFDKALIELEFVNSMRQYLDETTLTQAELLLNKISTSINNNNNKR